MAPWPIFSKWSVELANGQQHEFVGHAERDRQSLLADGVADRVELLLVEVLACFAEIFPGDHRAIEPER